MERTRVDGAGEVAALLRRMADGVDAHKVPMGDRVIPCQDDLVAVVEMPHVIEGRLLVINLHLSGETRAMRAVALEEELAHPGG